MKKKLGISFLLFLGTEKAIFAATGNANDGLSFFLCFIGFLLVISGIFTAIDYFKKNGLRHIHQAVALVWRKVHFVIKWMRHHSHSLELQP